MSFGEKFRATDNIKAIIDEYPFSIGIFREILQNSDDAGAVKQIFLLDRRDHGFQREEYAETQGPALLAFNDKGFLEEDWQALQEVHSSSKRRDTTKIGKYGIGFRSCYHITDNPQILSGQYFAAFDPHNKYGGSGRYNVLEERSQFIDQLNAFRGLLPEDYNGRLQGTVLRFPLRMDPNSEISSKVVEPEEIKGLLQTFWKEELEIVLLFLRHISTIEIHEIDAFGTLTVHATCQIMRRTEILSSDFDGFFASYRLRSCEVVVSRPEGRLHKTWQILDASYAREHASSVLFRTLNFNVGPALEKNKLSADLALAIPTTGKFSAGRLFTFLPLPLSTGFPVHVHGLFALTPSRQHLRNNSEHVVKQSDDSVLIHWNNAMFHEYLPKVWAVLLAVLCRPGSTLAHFRAWPPLQAEVECGESTNWKDLPKKFLEEVLQKEYSVWPAVNHRGELGHYHAQAAHLFLSPANSPSESSIIPILARAGILVSRIPAYIFDFLKNERYTDVRFLVPGQLYKYLMVHTNPFEALTYDDKVALLTYLLSNGNLDNIVELPLVPLPNRSFIALSRRGVNRTCVMLRQVDFEVFGVFDRDLISLDVMPPEVQALLREKGPSVLNLQRLDTNTVVRYLESTDINLSWINQFWTWVAMHCQWQGDLVYRIRDLCLLPSQRGLGKVCDKVFCVRDSRPPLTNALMKLQVPCLPSDFPDNARRFLTQHGCIMQIQQLPAILDRVAAKRSPMDELESEALLRHFIDQCMSLSNRYLTQRQRATLRSLDMFPLITTNAESGKKVVIGRVPETSEVEGVENYHVFPIPSIPNYTFVDISGFNGNLLYLLCPGKKALSVLDILTLSLKYFGSQSRSLQQAVVTYIADNVSSIPPSLIQTLKQTAFVPTANGAVKAPKDLIDPRSPMVRLYDLLTKEERLPEASSELVSKLCSLGLLQSQLSTAIVNERIDYLSSSSGIGDVVHLARLLLRFIAASSFDCSNIHISADKRWLPTNHGLKSHEECRDSAYYTPDLFDEVLSTVRDTSHSLHLRFGWNQPLSFDILREQFKCVIERGSPDKIRSLIKEFSSRRLEERQFRELRTVVHQRPWIPDIFSNLVPTERAVFEIPGRRMLSGFYTIPPSKESKFFESMGCPQRPSLTSLTNRLKELAKETPNSWTTKEAISVLKCIPTNAGDTNEILVPDVNDILRPSKDVVYNDLNPSILHNQHHLHFTHPRIEHALAVNLGIPFLGHQNLHIENLADYDMEQKLTTTIRNALSQYRDTQTLAELYANAVDAGATAFDIFLDECSGRDEALMSPLMKRFQGPSVVLHNNGEFSQEDWEGICRVGSGGKSGKTDTIGQFGLGALTMFHLTDLPMIVSGERVLFLDPSKTFLPVKGRATLLLPLRQVSRLYPDHLRPLDGLFKFRLDDEYYPGTLFRLPLRQKQPQDSRELLSASFPAVTIAKVLKDLVEPFQEHVQHYLLFTKVQTISFYHRRNHEPHAPHPKWKVVAARQIIDEDGPFTSQRVSIAIGTKRRVWNIVRGRDHVSLPQDYDPLRLLHRIRSPLVVGLAVDITEDTKTKRNSGPMSLFSTLPLPLHTNLPVHLTAPFILSSDRRNIRFGPKMNELETRYNLWLLSEMLQSNAQWWPEDPSISKLRSDAIVAIDAAVIDAFYNKLNTTLRRVFYTTLPSPAAIKCSQAILSGQEPEVFRKVLSAIQTCNTVLFGRSSSVFSRCRGITRIVDNTLVRDEILRDTPAFESWYQGVGSDQIQMLIEALSVERGNTVILEGLPLVPLLSGDLGRFQDASAPVKYYRSPTEDLAQLLRLLPQDRLVHPNFFEFLCEKRLQIGSNVMMLTPEGIYDLLRDRLPERHEYHAEASPATADVIEALWKLSRVLPEGTFKRLASFAIIPTTQANHYISIEHCESSSVIFTRVGADEDWLCHCLTAFGAVVVRPTHISRLPRGCIPSKDGPFKGLLAHLASRKAFIMEEYVALPKTMRQKFASWCRNYLAFDAASQDLMEAPWPSVKLLPIWPVYLPSTSGQVQELSTLEGVAMLSARHSDGNIFRSIVRFLSAKITPYNVTLKRIGVEEVSGRSLKNNFLCIPERLLSADASAYRSILSSLLWNDRELGVIRVPNEDLDLKNANVLYANDELFRAVFPGPMFLYEQFRVLEPHLYSYGLTGRHNLDINLFRRCASAFHDNMLDDDSTRINRANTLFRVYCEDLPVRVSAREAHSWRGLNHFRFIPAGGRRQRNSISGEDWTEQYVKPLPDIVSPNEAVRDNLAAVVWTQRVLFARIPDQRVLNANGDLGVPSIGEVVEHLKVLALRAARDHPKDRRILQDISKTYEWLTERHQHSELKEALAYLTDQPLFLNVDDPESEPWAWSAADEMCFNLMYTGNSRRLRKVHRYLDPFTKLLKAAGVEEIHMEEVLPIESSENESRDLDHFTQKFDQHRQAKRFVDVKFVPDRAEDDVEAEIEELWAHRDFLTTVSEYFETTFCSAEMLESQEAWVREPIVVKVTGHISDTIKAVLDFIYTGDIPDTTRTNEMERDPEIEGAVLGNLLAIIELARYWGVFDLSEKLQTRMIRNRLITPYTVDDILEQAGKIQADQLVKACRRYKEKNDRVIRLTTMD